MIKTLFFLCLFLLTSYSHAASTCLSSKSSSISCYNDGWGHRYCHLKDQLTQKKARSKCKFKTRLKDVKRLRKKVAKCYNLRTKCKKLSLRRK